MTALPDVPACWSLEMPPLPIPCQIELVRRWQNERCAICAVHVPERNRLCEDHDHATGETRGFLCERCNTSEGHSKHPCPGCWEIDRDRMSMLIGDGYGYRPAGVDLCGHCGGAPPLGFTRNTRGTVA